MGNAAVLAANLKSLVTENIRKLGSDCFYSRRVKIIQGNAWQVDAVAEGVLNHSVKLRRKANAIEASCSCVDASGTNNPCEHVWATILAADAKNYLQGDGRQTPNRLHAVTEFADSMVDYDEFEMDDEDSALVNEVRSESRRKLTMEHTQHKTPETSPGTSASLPKSSAWKDTLSSLKSKAEQQPPNTPNSLPHGNEIVYIVDKAATLEGKGLVLELASRYIKKDGEWSKSKGQSFSHAQIAVLPDPVDRLALNMLAGGVEAREYGYYGAVFSGAKSRSILTQTLAEALLPKLCATGRCFLSEMDAEHRLKPLQWDGNGPWEFWLKVEPEQTDQSCKLTGELRRGDERMTLRAPRLLIGGGFVFWENRVAPLIDQDAFSWLTLMRVQGDVSVPASEKHEFLAELLNLPRLPLLELPEDLRYEEVTLAPRPCVTFKRRKMGYWSGESDANWLVAELSFDYEGHTLPANSQARAVVQSDQRRMILRDQATERALSGRLDTLPFQRKTPYKQAEILELLARNLPKVARTLLQEGWRVEAEGKLYHRAGDFRIEVQSGIDWFELHGGANFGGQEVPLPSLLAALKRGDGMVALGDGSFGLLPEEWLKKYATLAGVGTPDGDHLRFQRTQVGLMDVLLAEQPEAQFDEQFERARERLRLFQGVSPAEPPAGFQGQLRSYQQDGLGWLHFLQEFGFGGCLADDMGLGKTVQVLALLETRRVLRAAPEKRLRPAPSLVVVPRSLVFNWKEEAARFAPNLRVLDHSGVSRGKPGKQFDDYDVILTTYGTLRKDIADIKDYHFDYAILDEAQAIKNSNSLSAKASRLIRAEHRLALSGTPVENHLGELWSLFDFLNPGMLGQVSASGKADTDLRKASEESATLLAKALRPFILRRTKAQVAKDLPEKSEQTIYCDMGSAQRKLYDELREHYRNSLLGRIARDGINKSKIQILEALLRLRQAACHPGLIDKEKWSQESSAKLDLLLPQLRQVYDEGHKTLVFSQFTSMLAFVKQRLDKEEIPYVYLDGRTRDRQERVRQFQEDPNCKVFLISLKAGGLGLNLTAADYIFLLDPWWNPAVESQAIDRAHRIGQTRPVFAYRLIARNTVEEKVLQLQAQKRDLADAIINADNSLIRTLGREDLELLLS